MFYNYGMIFLLIIFFNYILSFGFVGSHIEYCSRSHAEDMTTTNVMIKTPDRK